MQTTFLSGRWFGLLCFLAIFSFGATASPTLKDYAADPLFSNVTVSPDGNLVAFRKRESGQDTLIVFSLADSAMVAGFNLEEIKAHQFYFLDQDRIVLVASKELRGSWGREAISTAYSLDLKANTIQQLLTPGDNIFTAQAGLGFIVGVHGNDAFMPAFAKDVLHDRNPSKSLMKVDLASPRNPERLVDGTETTIDYFMGQDGVPLAREDYDEEKDRYDLLVQKDGEWTPIHTRHTKMIGTSLVGVRADYRSLVALGESKQSGRVEYWNVSLEDGEFSATDWGREDADIESVLTDINRVVHGVRYSGFLPSYKMMDQEVDGRISAFASRFPGHAVHLTNWNPGWKHLVFFVSGPTTPGAYFLASKGAEPVRILSLFRNISGEDMHPVGEVTVTARDGLSIPTLLTVPKATIDNMKQLPAVMLPHGGPESHDTKGYNWLTQALANAGYLVIQPQFRGSSGFGRAHRIAGHGEWGAKMQDDLTDTLGHLVDKGIVDPDRVCIAGASYGGYAALAGGAFTPELYRCVASINGVADIPRMMKREERDHGDDHQVVAYWNMVISRGEVDEAFMEKISPARSAEAFRAPVLLLHGTDDDTVAYKQSRVMYRALKRADKDVEMVKMKDESHHLENPENRELLLTELIAFLDKNIGAP